MCFCVSLELERGWLLVTKTVHRKCSSRGGLRIRGVTASLGRVESVGKRMGMVAYPRLGASVALGVDPDVLRGEKESVSSKEMQMQEMDCCGCC